MGLRVEGLGFKCLDFRVYGRMKPERGRAAGGRATTSQPLGLRVEYLGVRIYGGGFKVEDLGLRVEQ